MTPDEFKAAMTELSAPSKTDEDVERVHLNADDLMCLILRQLGYGDGVDIYEELDKWYA